MSFNLDCWGEAICKFQRLGVCDKFVSYWMPACVKVELIILVRFTSEFVGKHAPACLFWLRRLPAIDTTLESLFPDFCGEGTSWLKDGVKVSLAKLVVEWLNFKLFLWWAFITMQFLLGANFLLSVITLNFRCPTYQHGSWVSLWA